MDYEGKRILVVDDEQYLLSTIRLWLKVEGYDVSIADNGVKALQKIFQANTNDTTFDLIILDIQLPEMNGIQLMDKLKRLHIGIPVLVITGYGDRNLLMELMKRNCSNYLDKPFDEKILLLHVKNILGNREIHKGGKQNEKSVLYDF